MIIRGKSRAGAKSLGDHLLKTEKNERVDILLVRGGLSQNLHKALQDMEDLAGGTRCKLPLYHASLSPAPGERLTPKQWERAADIFAEQFGMEQHARVIVLHTKNGEQHGHIVLGRIDCETMTAAKDGHSYRKHELAARQIEQEFGLQRVQGVHVGLEQDMPRPERTLELWEMQQGNKTGIDPRHFREGVRALKMQCDNGQSFAAALVEHGVTLCQGDRRALVLVDDEGGVHSLSRAMGLIKAEMLAYLGDLDITALPTLEEARAHLRERNATMAQQPEKEPELIKPQQSPKQGREDAIHAHVSATAPEREAPAADPIKQQEHAADRQKITETIGDAWQKSDRDPLQFAINLGASGLTLAENEQGKFVAVDGQGRVHYLTENVLHDDPRAVQKAIAATFDGEGIGVASVDEIKAGLREEKSAERQAERKTWIEQRQLDRTIDRIEAAQQRPQTATAQEISRAWADSSTGAELVKELEERGFLVCRVRAEDAAKSQNDRALLGTVAYQEGEFLALNQYGHAFRINAETIGMTAANTYDHLQNVTERLESIEPASLLSVSQGRQVVEYFREATDPDRHSSRSDERGGADPAGLAAQGLGAALGVVEKWASGLESFFFSTVPPAQQYPKRGQIIQDEPITAGNARRMHDVQKRQDHTITPEDKDMKRDSVPHGVDEEYLARIRRMWEEQERERARDQERGGRER